MTSGIPTVIGCTIALAAIIVPGQVSMRRGVAGVHESMMRLEGAIEVLRKILTRRRSAGADRPARRQPHRSAAMSSPVFEPPGKQKSPPP